MGFWLVSFHSDDQWKWIYHLSCLQHTTAPHQNQRVCRFTCNGGFCVGMSVFPSLYFYDGTSVCNWPQAWLSWVNMIRWLLSNAFVTNLCNLVLDRYIATVKPLKYVTFMTRRRVIQMISLSWAIPLDNDILLITSLIFSAPLVSSICTWLVVIILEFLPCFMVAFCFANTVHVVYKHDRSERTLAKQLRFNHRVSVNGHDKSAVVMMAIVVGFFLPCYGKYLRCGIEILFNNQRH